MKKIREITIVLFVNFEEWIQIVLICYSSVSLSKPFLCVSDFIEAM